MAKRLMDYGFHAPTVSFPVPGTLMIEPTESEDEGRARSLLRRADRHPRRRSRTSSPARADAKDNVLKNAPHTAAAVSPPTTGRIPTRASRRRSRCRGCEANKFWPSVGRIDNPYGDRNLVCICPPMEAYED